MNNEEMLNLENSKDVDELKEELKTQATKEIKQYRNFLLLETSFIEPDLVLQYYLL